MGRKINDIAGITYGMLTALKPLDLRSSDGSVVWKCVCGCGNETTVRSSRLISQEIKSCGCLIKNNLTNNKFGKLLAIEQSIEKKSGGCIAWKCICDCGNKLVVRSSDLMSGNTRSCGCLYRESNATHGGSYTPEYGVWRDMLQRCINSNNKAYNHYGGRGITVCDRWLNSFENFITDMGNRPSGQHSIDRYPDNNGNYEPGNCRWTTIIEQQNNKRNNIFHYYNGKKYTALQISKEFNISPLTFRSRIRMGWSVEDSIKTPIQNYW